MTKSRARTRAIRARMAVTGESWVVAAREHDAALAERGFDPDYRVSGANVGEVMPDDDPATGSAADGP